MLKTQSNAMRSLYFSERMTTAMNRILEYPLTVIEAPMGYGKTTALREHLDNTSATVLWQRVYDDSKAGFWNGFSRLFHPIDPERSQRLAQLGLPNDGVSMQEALAIVSDVTLPEPTVLVIDDYHNVSSVEVNGFLENLVLNDIENLKIVLTARFTEFTRKEELHLKGYLHAVTKETFEFTPGEIKTYYRLCGITLSDQEVEKLYSHTEGWISALYLLMLNYQEEGSAITLFNIYKLVEKTVFEPLPDRMKDFLLTVCSFDSFSAEQACYLWGSKEVETLIAEIVKKNSFVCFESRTGAYQVHSILSQTLKKLLDAQDEAYRNKVYTRAGSWHMKQGQYLPAMQFFHRAGDFDSLMSVVDLDKTLSVDSDSYDHVIRYFDECPLEIKHRHPIAFLSYALFLMSYNENQRFQDVCAEFSGVIEECSDPELARELMGEFQLLLSFTGFNDITQMLVYIRESYALLQGPAKFIDTKGSWSFGSPSILYMFYRSSGTLEAAVVDLKAGLPQYGLLAGGHGSGAESILEGEWWYHQGQFDNAEIAAYKALASAKAHGQADMIVGALFLQTRIALIKGDYNQAKTLLSQMHEEVEQRNAYFLIHTLDICTGYVAAALRQTGNLPSWLEVGDMSSKRLLFPTMALANIIYGRILLIQGEYLKILGMSEEFLGVASVFPNLLGIIYTKLYTAASYEKIHRREDALTEIKEALDLAAPDKVYMPFVENGDFIRPLLEELQRQGVQGPSIKVILGLYQTYGRAIDGIIETHFSSGKVPLTAREYEIGQMAAQGMTNREISDQLFISTNTVKAILKSVFTKLSINNRVLLERHFKIS